MGPKSLSMAATSQTEERVTRWLRVRECPHPLPQGGRHQISAALGRVQMPGCKGPFAIRKTRLSFRRRPKQPSKPVAGQKIQQCAASAGKPHLAQMHSMDVQSGTADIAQHM